jgi:hypothetical protein
MTNKEQIDLFLNSLKKRNKYLVFGYQLNEQYLELPEKKLEDYEYRWTMLVSNRKMMLRIARESERTIRLKLKTVLSEFGFDEKSKQIQSNINLRVDKISEELMLQENDYGTDLYLKIGSKTITNSSFKEIIKAGKVHQKITESNLQMERKQRETVFSFYQKKSVEYGIIASSLEEIIQIVDKIDSEKYHKSQIGNPLHFYGCVCRKYTIGDTHCGCGLHKVSVTSKRKGDSFLGFEDDFKMEAYREN